MLLILLHLLALAGLEVLRSVIITTFQRVAPHTHIVTAPGHSFLLIGAGKGGGEGGAEMAERGGDVRERDRGRRGGVCVCV